MIAERRIHLDLIKITDLSAQLGLSSRTLRYYEEVGLIKSIRPQFEAYRFYDETAIKRHQKISALPLLYEEMDKPLTDTGAKSGYIWNA